MKRSLIIFAVVTVLFGKTSVAQPDATPQKQLLTSYYEIKNALVAGNSSGAVRGADAFIRSANSIDYKIISEGNIHVLLKDAGALSAAKDLKTQREIFANLSKNMADVARVVKLTGDPVYKQYCPMKKAYWLSSEKTVKNPYFGNSMLTCGTVEGTIQ